jgi:dTDP-4-dehydrorhamnose 3,5-epimerase
MKATAGTLPDVVILEPRIFGDDRGFFLESYNKRSFQQLTGIATEFVQDNHSRSAANVLRGLHYQVQQAQGKLIRVVAGEIFDVVVDLRRSSSFFGRWMGHRLSAQSKQMLWVPAGFAHGFLALSDGTEVLYKTTDYYAPEHERCVLWNDPAVGIDWPLSGAPVVSDKDRQGIPLKQADTFA